MLVPNKPSEVDRGEAVRRWNHGVAVLLLTVGLIAGTAVGTIAMAFLAIATYERGYADGSGDRNPLRFELAARRRIRRSTARSAA